MEDLAPLRGDVPATDDNDATGEITFLEDGFARVVIDAVEPSMGSTRVNFQSRPTFSRR